MPHLECRFWCFQLSSASGGSTQTGVNGCLVQHLFLDLVRGKDTFLTVQHCGKLSDLHGSSSNMFTNESQISHFLLSNLQNEVNIYHITVVNSSWTEYLEIFRVLRVFRDYQKENVRQKRKNKCFNSFKKEKFYSGVFICSVLSQICYIQYISYLPIGPMQ